MRPIDAVLYVIFSLPDFFRWIIAKKIKGHKCANCRHWEVSKVGHFADGTETRFKIACPLTHPQDPPSSEFAPCNLDRRKWEWIVDENLQIAEHKNNYCPWWTDRL